MLDNTEGAINNEQLVCIFTFVVPCCDVCYDIRIKKMFGSPLLILACRGAWYYYITHFLNKRMEQNLTLQIAYTKCFLTCILASIENKTKSNC
jgi:hypothetical protein